jgi:hypothetical protein
MLVKQSAMMGNAMHDNAHGQPCKTPYALVRFRRAAMIAKIAEIEK